MRVAIDLHEVRFDCVECLDDRALAVGIFAACLGERQASGLGWRIALRLAGSGSESIMEGVRV